jgi:hypothetical protein
MSDVEQEPQEPVEEPTEAPQEPSEPEPEPEPEDEPAAPQQPSEGESLEAEKAVQDEAYNALAKRAKSYADSIGKVLEGTPLPLAVCELCSDAYPGMRWAEPQSDAANLALEAFHGSFQLETLEEADWTDRCRSCRGLGWVKTKGLVRGNEAIVCKRCNGAGYVVLDQDSGLMEAPVPSNGDTIPAPIAGVNPDDPEIAGLIARGYTIIPPLQPAVAPSQEWS